MAHTIPGPMYVYFKSLCDFVLASLLFLVSLPVFIHITILLFFANKGKPFFYQLRPGKGERIFKIVKFRSMNEQRDAQGELLPDEERITKVGAFVRKTSLDELPQLINVIKGEMSFVGPRPLLVSYLPLYNAEQKRRHDVKPGITGWAQVNGRNALSWEEKFKHDVWYVDHFSLGLDMQILFKTIGKVINRDGISSETSATMEKFEGTPNHS